jgi:hypothetical protein
MTTDQLRALAQFLLKENAMAKKNRLGAGLGSKEAAPPGAPIIRETMHTLRVKAVDATIDALKNLNHTERTSVLAAAAEFYKLTFTVDNG